MPSHYQGDESVRRALDAFIKFSRARKTLEIQANRFLADYGLTESQLGALEAIYYLGPMSQRDIAEKMLVTGGNITMVISNLEKHGLVCRQRSESDRRHLIVSLTEKGQQLIGELFPRHAQNIADMMNILAPTEQDQLGELCKILGRQIRNGDHTE